MKRLLLSVLFSSACLLSPVTGSTEGLSPSQLPNEIPTGPQGKFHVQGIAVDQLRGFIYFSFTNELIKTDLKGHLIGSVTGLVGHLGDLTYDPLTDRVFGSLEYKDDRIGTSIRKKLDVAESGVNAFYVAIFDGAKITRPHIDASTTDVVKAVYLKEVAEDYQASVKVGAETAPHRYGCSGIDGITLGPGIGSSDGGPFLYIAYGIYGDVSRDDNDHQVILQYDIHDWAAYARPLSQDALHTAGPEKPASKYFLYTGNTSYGIQNLEYDPASGNFFAAVYPGKKPNFPHHSLFVIDGRKAPHSTTIQSDGREIEVQALSLLDAGEKDEESGTRGWNFKYGATGLTPLGDGYFYLARKEKIADQSSSTAVKYRWIGEGETAFEEVSK